MELRGDALTAAAEFVLAVESLARNQKGIRATVGHLGVTPGAVNVVPGSARLSLDLRHARDDVREQALADLLKQAQAIAGQRRVGFQVEEAEHHPAVPADAGLREQLSEVVRASGYPVHRMVSGAGHDAAIMAALAPMAMLFVRSPGGISHHPDEAVLPVDVRAALEVIVRFVESFEATVV
jgi:allantoate deiminase